MLLYMSGVNDNINGNYTQLWHITLQPIFTFWKIFTANLRILWRHLRCNCEMFSALQSTSAHLTQGENTVQIDA